MKLENRNKLISIDVGGTKLHGVVFDLDLNIIGEIKVPTKKDEGRKGLLNLIYSIIDTFISKYKISGIGIASAGRINYEKGYVYFATDNLPEWTGTNLKKLIESKYNIYTIVENDVNSAGIGEHWLGEGKGFNSSVCVTLGTGIAASIIINNKLIRGSHWSTGEVGHMVLYPHGEKCNCGLRGCFEQYCSGTALVKAYNKKSKLNLKSGYDFFDKVDKNDKVALEVIDKFVEDLAIAIINLANIVDPDIFIIGGGLIDTKKYWWDKLICKISDSALTNIFVPDIQPAKLKNYAGLYGVAFLLLHC